MKQIKSMSIYYINTLSAYQTTIFTLSLFLEYYNQFNTTTVHESCAVREGGKGRAIPEIASQMSLTLRHQDHQGQAYYSSMMP
jgi:hypothetical protein